jgi:hypothetical protein
LPQFGRACGHVTHFYRQILDLFVSTGLVSRTIGLEKKIASFSPDFLA